MRGEVRIIGHESHNAKNCNLSADFSVVDTMALASVSLKCSRLQNLPNLEI